MFRLAIAICAVLTSMPAKAQLSPVGLWKTVSDSDGRATSEIRISEADGELVGKIERNLDPRAKLDDVCVECKGDRKNQPITGLEIIRAAKKAAGKDVWEGGTIVDPDNGAVYKLKMIPVEGGKKLEVRGFLGVSFLGRTQVWIRVE